MKRINKIKALLLASTLVVTSACENFLDVNTDPNNLVEAGVQFLLPGSQIGTGFLLGNTIQSVDALWVQHTAGTGTQTDPYDRYVVSPNDFNNEWNGLYANVLDDLQEVITTGQAEGNFKHAGMAQILQAYVWAITTDTWGDVPFTQALNYDTHAKPGYDKQEDIYPKLIAQVDAGLANLVKTNLLATSAGDLIYGGDTDKWIRAANSLKLKLYIQSRHKNAEAAKAGINALIAENKFISSNAGNFNVQYFTSSGSQNPIYQYNHLTRLNDQLISRRYYDSLSALNDPRIPYFVTPVGSAYVTYDNGQYTSVNFTSANRSRYGMYVVGNGTLAANGSISGAGAAPMRLITKSMVNFWLAEAALTLGTTGNAVDYYKQAIRDNFEDIRTFNNVTAASFSTDAEAYITRRELAFNTKLTTEGKLNVLIRDKWASSVGNAYEAYNDYRRTGFPRLALAQNAQSGVTRIPTRWPYVQTPTRWPYVQTEIQANGENVPVKEYPTGMLGPVWWMKQ
jgi:hypothetical protein